MGFHRVKGRASIPALALAVLLSLAIAAPARAVTLLRDADIEYGLYVLAFPILRAAGLSPTRTRVLVVANDKLNAFVLDQSAIYLHSGLIQKVGSAGMVQAVIAHEAAHISNGHLARRLNNLQGAQTIAGLGMLLAVAASAAGAGSDASGIGLLAASVAQRSFLTHTRAEEAAADRSAAAYLQFAGISARALVDLHKALLNNEILSVSGQDPYMLSHPLTADRVRAAEAYVAAHKAPSGVRDPDTDYWFARVRGKLTAFRMSPKWTLHRVKSEKFADVAKMREAVAWHRQSNMTRALAALDQAIALRPDDPFYYDLRGQILMENRRTHAAVAAYRKAVELAPNQALILGGLGRALLADVQPRAAMEPLVASLARDFRNAYVLRDLGQAYAATGQTGMAALASAERYALLNRQVDAARQARRAMALLPEGSPGWRRAEDVLVTAEKLSKGKKR